MSATVLPNYSQVYGHNWMLAQMSNYPPLPQQDHQQQYHNLYPSSGSPSQLLDPVHQEQLQYNNLNQPVYPKVESNASVDHNTQQQINALAHDLHQQAALEEQQRQHLAAHQFHQVSQGPTSGNITAPEQQLQHHQGTPELGQKANRLRKACDSCSIRKVKCDESGPPCRACLALDIPCTFERPSRRRGPPNRHAEAIKRRRLEEAASGSPQMTGTPTSSPSSPTHAAQALASLSTHTSQGLSAESICPIETLDLLIDEFFICIHPLTPFPHEPTFREAWKRRDDLHDKPFLALLASMICTLVSSFPRKPRLHLKAQKRETMFPNHLSLVNRCQQVCTAARGVGYLEREDLNVYDAATSYFLGLTGIYTYRWRQGRLYIGECMTILKTLGLHRATERTCDDQIPTVFGSHLEQKRNPVDNITQEIGRRIFWTMFVGVKALQQLGASFSEIFIQPPTSTDPYPPLPAEVDDEHIYLTHTESQPDGQISKITGFNANVRVYASYDPVSTMEMAWGVDSVIDWEAQKRVLWDALRRCKRSISQLPPELVVCPLDARADDLRYEPNLTAQVSILGHSAQTLEDPSTRTGPESNEDQRRTAFLIQQANIYGSSLATRSYLVEKYFNLCEAHERSRNRSPNSPATGVIAAGISSTLSPTSGSPSEGSLHVHEEMGQEREDIVKDLLVVLSSINQVSMEPNADSFTMKIRAIAGTLLEASDGRKGVLATQAQEYLSAFLKILVKLERVSPTNSDPEQPVLDDEESELRHWADLREYQIKFAQQGGFLGFS